MRVDDALHVRPLLHDAQVERPFAGGLAAVGGVDDLALHVDGADVVEGDLRLGHLGGRDENDVLIRAQGEIAALAGHKPQLGKAVRRRHQLFDLRGILLLEIVHGSHAPCMRVFGARLRGGSRLPPPGGGVKFSRA